MATAFMVMFRKKHLVQRYDNLKLFSLLLFDVLTLAWTQNIAFITEGKSVNYFTKYKKRLKTYNFFFI